MKYEEFIDQAIEYAEELIENDDRVQHHRDNDGEYTLTYSVEEYLENILYLRLSLNYEGSEMEFVTAKIPLTDDWKNDIEACINHNIDYMCEQIKIQENANEKMDATYY